jgi:hypothetical protein
MQVGMALAPGVVEHPDGVAGVHMLALRLEPLGS